VRSGIKYLLLDTNAVLYLLKGDQLIRSMVEDSPIYLSFISEIELLSYPTLSLTEEALILAFLQDAVVIEYNASIKRLCIAI